MHSLMKCAVHAFSGHEYSAGNTNILSELKINVNFDSWICYRDVWRFFDSCMTPVREDSVFCWVGCRQSLALGQCNHLNVKRWWQSVYVFFRYAVLLTPFMGWTGMALPYLWQSVLISCLIFRFVETSSQKATWAETNCDISNIRCSKILTVFFWSSHLYDPRTHVSSRSSIYEGTWDRLSWCLTHYSHADSSTWTSRYLHLYSRCGQVHLHLCSLSVFSEFILCSFGIMDSSLWCIMCFLWSYECVMNI